MTKSEAKEKIHEIIKESNAEDDRIIETAKANGIWKPGLDTNKELFAKNNRETKEKIQSIIAMIDE